MAMLFAFLLYTMAIYGALVFANAICNELEAEGDQKGAAASTGLDAIQAKSLIQNDSPTRAPEPQKVQVQVTGL